VLPAIALGGVAGAATRSGIVELLPNGVVPWGVLVANVLGSAVLGWAATRLLQLPAAPRSRRKLLALSSGFCGSLTTFSAFAVDIADSLREGATSWGLGYLVTSAFAGAVAVWAGHRIAAASTPAGPPQTP